MSDYMIVDAYWSIFGVIGCVYGFVGIYVHVVVSEELGENLDYFLHVFL